MAGAALLDTIDDVLDGTGTRRIDDLEDSFLSFFPYFRVGVMGQTGMVFIHGQRVSASFL